jgi:hypothetical protein
VVCVETRHMRAVLKAQINKTDPMMRAAPFDDVHLVSALPPFER